MTSIDSLINEDWLRTPRIIEAFKKIKRVDFLPEDIKNLAELNTALPIGFGQTISQPLVVAFMIEHLQPRPGDNILDIGSGSGWTTALLAEIVGGQGKVFGMEIIPELKEFGKENVSKYNFVEKKIAEFICADASKGYPNMASHPELAEGFDKILASASARRMPRVWKEQLKIGGRIVTPIGTSIWVFIKKSEKKFAEIEFPGFIFVPLVEK
ncbi:protein-L-isoaspartate O-methyltransferase [Patescibacteria group bacterium]|nr:protein-L-isoaspartate O-methyltransferase [Patescibacteria group bacterium]